MKRHIITCFIQCQVIVFMVLCITANGQQTIEKRRVRQANITDSPLFFKSRVANPRDVHGSRLYSVDVNMMNFAYDTFDSILQPGSPAILGVLLPHFRKNGNAGGEVKSYSKYFYSFIVPDSTPATFLALGINGNNYRDYQYHVVLNDSTEVVPWSPVIKLEKKHGVKKAYANLGTYRYPGQQVLVEVVNKKDYHNRDGLIVDWRPLYKPVVKEIYLSGQKGTFNIRHEKYAPYVSLFDNNTNLPLDLRIPSDSVKSIGIRFGVHDGHPLFAALIKENGNKKDTSILSRVVTSDLLVLNGYRFSSPGHYELLICRQLYEKDLPKYNAYLLRMPFAVYKPKLPAKNVSIWTVISYLFTGLLLAFSFFLWYHAYNRRKLKKAAYHQRVKQIQLQSIRSQLNPHFVFNALSSIRHLVHKNHVQLAENYLTRFAELTRAILDTSEEELICLEDELKMLDNYLQMEKLRFSFDYTITADESIHTINTEIPAMLLQPLVENAVKHGVAALEGKGRIAISAKRMEKTLELTVSDNGKGLVSSAPLDTRKHKGFWLSRQRIRLLNETYGSEVITMGISSSGKGTAIIITLKNWLS